MKTILFFEDTFSVHGVYPATVVSASDVPDNFVYWGTYSDARGHGLYQMYENSDSADVVYLAVDISHERYGYYWKGYTQDAWETRQKAAPYLRAMDTETVYFDLDTHVGEYTGHPY